MGSSAVVTPSLASHAKVAKSSRAKARGTGSLPSSFGSV